MDRIYYKDQDNQLSSFTDKQGYEDMCEKHSHLIGLTEITHDEAYAIANPPPTQAQRLDEIEDYVASILETEMKDTKYFMGYGFKYGRDSVARYPTDEEAIKLTAWQKAIWEQCSIWRGEISAGTLQISTLTESYLNENLPNIDDF